MKLDKKIWLSVIITFIITSLLVSGVFIYTSFTYLDLGTIARAVATIDKYYYKDVDKNALINGAISGMMQSLGDEYSWYVDEESYKMLEQDMDGTYTGIGVMITIDPNDKKIKVISPIEDTPAYKAGLSTNDKILSIDDVAISYDNYAEAVKLMRGDINSVGKEVKLLILKDGASEPIELKLIREKIRLRTVKSKMLADNIGYIRITTFENNTYTEFMDELNKLGIDNLKGLVIDLRFNPGGAADSTVKIADELLPEGLISYFQFKDGTREEFKSDSKYLNIPLSVIVNKGSASAAELLTGALKDYNRAVVVGETTFGKGIVQFVLPFAETPKGTTALYITTASYYTPKGVCIQKTGIEPNIVVPTPANLNDLNIDTMTTGNDLQLKTAFDEVKKQIK